MASRSPDQEIEATTYRWVGRALLSGLLLSIVVMAVGLIWIAISGSGAPGHVLPLQQVPEQLATGQPAAVLDLGILLLFATPLAGILIALSAFLREGDGAFTVVTLLLLAILVVGFVVALH